MSTNNARVDYMDDFITLVRTAANDANQAIPVFLHALLDDSTSTEGSKKLIPYDAFESNIGSIRNMKKKITKADLKEIFDECNYNDDPIGITIDSLINYCQRNVSKARTMSLKLRQAIVSKNRNEADFKRIFGGIKSFTVGGTKFAEMDSFREFAEDTMDMVINESDGVVLYGLYDCDGDGRVSCDDFVKFISSQTSSTDAAAVLSGGNENVIVDIQLSTNRSMEAELQQQGYTCVFPQFATSVNAMDKASFGSFGRGQSMWIWRRSQGTCGGRLKPIVDIQLDNNKVSSALVLSGYTCLSTAISGQYVWLKRAQTLEEEENEAIVELFVSTGKMKNPSDPIWQGPSGGGTSSSGGGGRAGVGRDGWIRIDGNFGKGMMSFTDSFLWFQPLAPKSLDAYMASPIRQASTLTDEKRFSLLLSTVQTSIRDYVPLREMKNLANPKAGAGADSFNYYTLFQLYDTSYSGGALSYGNLERLLTDVGLHMEKADMSRCFYFFNIKQDKYISHEEFGAILTLTEYNVDLVTELIRKKLMGWKNAPGGAQGARSGHDATSGGGGGGAMAGGSSGSASLRGKGKSSHALGGGDDVAGRNAAGKSSTLIKENRLLSNIFNMINLNHDGVLSVDEVQALCYKLNIYVTEYEASMILSRMDVNKDDRVEESDFINFVQRTDDMMIRKANRVRESAGIIRRFLRRRSGTGSSTTDLSFSTATMTPGTMSNKQHTKEWNEFKRRHEVVRRKFPGYLNVEDIMLLLATLGVRLAPVEIYEVIYIIALDKNGKVYPNDMDAFATRSCRTFGELVALLDRDVLAPLLNIYRNYRDSVRKDDENSKQLTNQYHAALKDIVKAIQDAYSKEVLIHKSTGSSAGGGDASSSKITVVSVSAMKRGLEDALKGYQTPDQNMPNLEEYVCLAVLVGADIAQDGMYGINIGDFVQGLCRYIVGDLYGTAAAAGGDSAADTVSLDMICKDLRRMLLEEAVNSAFTSASSKYKGDIQMARRNPDYAAVFALFDEDHSGNITINEFRELLVRLQLVDALPPEQLPALIEKFDKSKKGSITCEDFIAFVKAGGGGDFLVDDDDDDGSVSSDMDLEMMHHQNPPVAITQHADCDYLTWQLWRQCMLLDAHDPESVITDVETACCDVEVALIEAGEGDDDEDFELGRSDLFATNRTRAPSGFIAKDELWQIIKDLHSLVSADPEGDAGAAAGEKPRNQSANMFISKALFDKGVIPLLDSKKGAKEAGKKVDYETLCRYVIKMGRAFNARIQEKHAAEEKKYQEMKQVLLTEMVSVEVTAGATEKDPSTGATVPGAAVTTSKLSKYEKIFKRLDRDGDGKISCEEFKFALKRCKFKDEKYWTLAMVRKLFNDLDEDHNGDLTISELTHAIRAAAGGASTASGAAKASPSKSKKLAKSSSDKGLGGRRNTNRGMDSTGVDDDDDDDNFGLFIRRKKLFSDYELYRKVFDILLDTVSSGAFDVTAAPRNGTNKHTSAGNNVDNIISVVKNMFRRSDPEHKGVVSEERFISFCRRSDVSDRLSTIEFRRLLDNLRTTNDAVNSHTGSTKSLLSSAQKKRLSGGGALVNYELFCQMLASVSESTSHGNADKIVCSLREAGDQSAAQGRPFLMLCQLMDNKDTGKVSIQELQHIVKMMGLELSVEDIHILRELMQATGGGNALVSRTKSRLVGLDSGAGSNNILIDYFELNELVETYTPRVEDGTPSAGRGTLSQHGRMVSSTAITPSLMRGGSLPAYATPGGVTRVPGPTAAHPQGRLNSTSNAGLNTLLRSSNSSAAGGARGRAAAGNTATTTTRRAAPASPTPSSKDDLYSNLIVRLCEATNKAVSDRAASWGRNFLLQRQFEEFDREKLGFIEMAHFQIVLEEDLGLSLRSSEIAAVRHYFTVDEASPADDVVDYQYFCLFCDQIDAEMGPAPSVSRTASGRAGATSAGATRRRPPRAPGASSSLHSGADRLRDREAQEEAAPTAARTPPYLNETVIRKYFELQDSNKDVRTVLEAQDADETGLVDIGVFAAVIKKLHLLQYEYQLTKLLEDFRSINDPSLILYEDFCVALETEAIAFLKHASANAGVSASSSAATTVRRGRAADPIASDDPSMALLDSGTVDDWFHRHATPKQQREFSNVYGSITQFKQQHHAQHGRGGRGGTVGDSMRGHSTRGSANAPDIVSIVDSDDEDLDRYLRGSVGGAGSRYPPSSSVNASVQSLYPPKPSSSFQLSNHGHTSTGSRLSSSVNSPLRGSNSAPTHSPSRIGAAMWGSDTPLTHKGFVMEHGQGEGAGNAENHRNYNSSNRFSGDHDDSFVQPHGGALTVYGEEGGGAGNKGRWICPVCYYSENAAGAQICMMCDSPNHATNKEYQLKEQCNNCTFLNGAFARNCEMCGEALKSGTSGGGGGLGSGKKLRY